MKYTNNLGLPQSIFDAITKETYDLNKLQTNVYSATTLINSPKINLLQIRHWDEIEQDIDDNVWRLLGSAVHYIIDKAKSNNRLTEERIFFDCTSQKIVKIPDDHTHVYLTGKPDLYDSDGYVYDYKVTSTWTVIKGIKREHEQQLNIYAWLYRMLGFDVKGLRICAILRDWSRMKALTEPEYPKSAMFVQEIPLWDMHFQERFIYERLSFHTKQVLAHDDRIPECTPEERWAKPDQYAVMKEGRKSALKLFEDEGLATEYAKLNSGYVVKRAGCDGRCKDYCSVNRWCHYYNKVYGKHI